MRERTIVRGVVVAAGLAWPTQARAGMPMVVLTDAAALRLSTISFFLVLLLLSAWAVQGIWNAIRSDLPRLPRLSYGKALGVVTLWGLLFVLVLTMISGARELLTPGAWKKTGLTYKLTDEPSKLSEPPPTRLGPALWRREKLEHLRALLNQYARAHDGHFPSDDASPDIPPEAWTLHNAPGLRFLYKAGHSLGEPGAIVAFEPGVYETDRLVLFADGEIRLMDKDALRKGLKPATPAEKP